MWVIKSVIIVDDNEDIVDSLSMLLESNSIEVVGKGYDGLEGVQLFDKLHPGVVLLDIAMPQYDGLYTLRKIREKDSITPVIIITGYLSENYKGKIKDLKPIEILYKPIRIKNLMKLLIWIIWFGSLQIHYCKS